MRYFIKYGIVHNPEVLLASEGEQGLPYTEVSLSQYHQALEYITQQNYLVPVQEKQVHFRRFRKEQFAAFDIYKSNLAFGIIQEDQITHERIVSWYNYMLRFPETITIDNYDTIEYPVTPPEIQDYL